MALSKSANTRDVKKEGFWRNKLEQWKESGKSQSQFCREEGLNPNTFSSWKRVIPEREAESRRSGRVRKHSPSTNSSLVGHVDVAPAFIRLAISDAAENDADTENRVAQPERSAYAQPSIAAELTDAGSGRRVRIFNGADQATVAALLSALASNRAIGF